MTNKGIQTDNKIVIESENDVKIESKGKNSVLDIKAGPVIHDDEILVEMFDNHYVNIVETLQNLLIYLFRVRSLVVNDLRSESKCSLFEFGCINRPANV